MVVRIIPALAGNRPYLRFRFRFGEDHPRTRREQSINDTPEMREVGSSPHSQGTEDAPNVKRNWNWIIPALAGNSGRYATAGSLLEDHPRTRREQGVLERGSQGGAGSSPHSQGTALTTAGRNWAGGIIPALAGNSLPYDLILFA